MRFEDRFPVLRFCLQSEPISLLFVVADREETKFQIVCICALGDVPFVWRCNALSLYAFCRFFL